MANNFTTDSSVKALWRFESGVITVDSIGGNTLSNNAVVSDTNTKREGNASAYFNGASSLAINDASEDSGFPFKNGTSNNVATFCFWFRPDSAALSGYPGIFGKLNYGTAFSFIVDIRSGSLCLLWGYGSGGTSFEQWTIQSLIASHDYHIALSIDAVNKIASIVIYDATAGALTNYGNIFNNQMQINNLPFVIGAENTSGNYIKGWIDEFVVFNRVLNKVEILAIRNQVYAGPLTNNFASDSACIANWNFEPPPNLRVDSIGTNNLVAQNPLYYSDVCSPICIQGLSSIWFRVGLTLGYNWGYILDTNLNSGFPFKYGTGNKQLTFCGWIQPRKGQDYYGNNLGGPLLAKTSGNSGFQLYFPFTDPANLKIDIGDGTATTTYDTGISFPMNAGQWYHVSFELDGTTSPSLYVRVYSLATGVVSTYTTTPVVVAINNAYLGLGTDSGHADPTTQANPFNGYCDQWVIWNRLLSVAELDKVRGGTFVAVFTRNLTSTCAVTSAVSAPVAVITRPLASSPAIASTVATPQLGTGREMQSSVTMGSVTAAPLLAVLRKLASSFPGVTGTGVPILSVVRPFISSVGAVSAVSTPSLAIQRALASLATVLGATSDVHLLLNAILNLTATVAIHSQVSSPGLNIVRPLNSAMSSQTQTSAAILAVLRPLTASVAGGTQTLAIALMVLRGLASTITAQGMVSIPALNLNQLLATVAHITSGTSDAALAVIRNLVAAIAAQTSIDDVILIIRVAIKLFSAAIAVQTQTSDIDLILTFYESLLAKANRHYGPINADALEAAALQWLSEEEEKGQHLPQQEYDG